LKLVKEFPVTSAGHMEGWRGGAALHRLTSSVNPFSSQGNKSRDEERINLEKEKGKYDLEKRSYLGG
jgi:hypothetical protein